MYFFDRYSCCSACGNLHDDGMIVDVQGNKVFLCFDCADKLPLEKAKQAVWIETQRHATLQKKNRKAAKRASA